MLEIEGVTLDEVEELVVDGVVDETEEPGMVESLAVDGAGCQFTWNVTGCWSVETVPNWIWYIAYPEQHGWAMLPMEMFTSALGPMLVLFVLG